MKELDLLISPDEEQRNTAFINSKLSGKTCPTQHEPNWWESPRFQEVCVA